MKGREKIAALTAYDYPMARLLDECGIPLLLVGDSLGMMVLGYPDTTHVTMDEMVHHTRAVARAKPKALCGSDLPFHSYDTPEQALANAERLISAGAEFVKAEGGREILPQVQAIVGAGIPFIGHLGMLPQHVLEEGGKYRIKGRDERWPHQTSRRRVSACGRRRLRRCAGTRYASRRHRNYQRVSFRHDWNRLRAGLRRPNPGDAGFGRNVSVVHAEIHPATSQRSGTNAVGGGRLESLIAMKKLTHLDPTGAATMVDVSAKPVQLREAVASGEIQLQRETLDLIEQNQIAKGNVLATARLAGIMAAKKTGDLIPLCHPLPISHCEVRMEIPSSRDRILITASAKIAAQTGVEMEALTAVSIAALTIYDMCKAVDKQMRITDIVLTSKTKK